MAVPLAGGARQNMTHRYPTIIPRSRGFTLLETVTAMAISSVLFLALGSTIAIAARAIPTGDEPVIAEGEISRGFAIMAADLEVATSITRTAGLTLEVPDRDGDGRPDTIVYDWITGDRYMTRTWNGGSTETLFGPLANGNVVFTQSGRVYQRVLFILSFADHTPAARLLSVELLNQPEAP